MEKKALEKITKELEELKVKAGYCSEARVLVNEEDFQATIDFIEEQLATREGLAERILLDSKTFKGALQYASSAVPKKIQELKMTYISQRTVLGWILDYYFEEEKPKPQPKVQTAKKPSAKELKEMEEEAKRKEKERKEEEYRKKNGIAQNQLSMFDLFGIEDDEEGEEDTTEEKPKEEASIIRPVTSASIPDVELDKADVEKELTAEPEDIPFEEPDLGFAGPFELDEDDKARLPFEIM